MKVYKVTNGFIYYGPLHVIVAAQNEETAKQYAQKMFKDKEPDYNPFWTNLEVEFLFDLEERSMSEVLE